MAKIPIKVEKIQTIRDRISLEAHEDKKQIFTEYLITIVEKGHHWDKTIRCNVNDLTKLRDEISKIIKNSTTAEKLRITEAEASLLDEHYAEDPLCQGCNLNLTHNCLTCIFTLQSPLERKLFLALKASYIPFVTQYALNWKGQNISIAGKTFSDPENNFKEVLTVTDFYVEKRGVQLCIYTDGHSYHERTEDQAKRDKRIDRKLQELGFKVLRYTGKEVNEDVDKIISEIKNWISY